MVGALHSAFGEHHARAVHAKGVILRGRFTPTAEASALSSASVFASGTVPVTVRFSDFTGIPTIPDTISEANPRGFAVRFNVPEGGGLDVVSHSFNGFPARTSDEFAQLLRAIGASGVDAVKPTELDRFLATHPIAKTFLTTQKPPPVSYATLTYYGVNAFFFVERNGRRSPVRYRFVPLAGEQFLDAATLRSKGSNYLSEEIATRAENAPVGFEWWAQIAEPADVLDDPSVSWPETRRLVKIGTISMAGAADSAGQTDKSLSFMPGTLPRGIEAADPMIGMRNAAYPISFSERQ
jgi:catalase